MINQAREVFCQGSFPASLIYVLIENALPVDFYGASLSLSEGEKATLAEIAHRLGRMVLEDVAATAKPDTILGWYRQQSTLDLTSQDLVLRHQIFVSQQEFLIHCSGDIGE
jgi:hypothetical protein